MLKQNRTVTEQAFSDLYRYGFQGQERDDEVKGAGNSVNYTFRMHDPRVGRFFAVDPLATQYPENGPYNFQENKLGLGVELEGLELAPHPLAFQVAYGINSVFMRQAGDWRLIEAREQVVQSIMEKGKRPPSSVIGQANEFKPDHKVSLFAVFRIKVLKRHKRFMHSHEGNHVLEYKTSKNKYVSLGTYTTFSPNGARGLTGMFEFLRLYDEYLSSRARLRKRIMQLTYDIHTLGRAIDLVDNAWRNTGTSLLKDIDQTVAGTFYMDVINFVADGTVPEVGTGPGGTISYINAVRHAGETILLSDGEIGLSRITDVPKCINCEDFITTAPGMLPSDQFTQRQDYLIPEPKMYINLGVKTPIGEWLDSPEARQSREQSRTQERAYGN